MIYKLSYKRHPPSIGSFCIQRRIILEVAKQVGVRLWGSQQTGESYLALATRARGEDSGGKKHVQGIFRRVLMECSPIQHGNTG